jgi:hypothetical protein
MSIHPFLTNLEDEISVKGGRICKAQNMYKKKTNNKIIKQRNKNIYDKDFRIKKKPSWIAHAFERLTSKRKEEGIYIKVIY